MGESHNLMNLEWVQADIEQTLQQAQECLETCLSDSENQNTHLQNCVSAIHQVTGSLQMVGLEGAVLLSEHVESVLTSLLSEPPTNRDEAFTALAQALVHLPPYLTRAKNDGAEAPILLLKAVNDLRQVLGEPLILEYSLFAPSLDQDLPLATSEQKTFFREQCVSHLGKQRQIFQFALIGLIRNEDTKVNLVRISNVLNRLRQDCAGAPIYRLWEISGAMIEGMIDGDIPLTSDLVELLRSLDKAIKNLTQNQEAGLDANADTELLKAMLYRIAKSDADSALIASVKNRYALDQCHVDHQAGPSLFVGPDKETLTCVVHALSEELQRIKDTIDLYVRNEVKSNIDLGGLRPSLKQIASTLVMLNLDEPKALIQEQLNLLSEHSQAGSEIPNQKLVNIAESLLFVEEQLQGVVNQAKSSRENSIAAYADKAAQRVILESLANLKQAQDDVQEFVTSNAEMDKLEQVPSILRGASGGLSMILQPVAAQLAYAVAQYVEDDIVAQDRNPEAQTMEQLADVLSSIELYLQGLAEQGGQGNNALDQAKSLMANLGYPVEQVGGISSEREWQQDERIETAAADTLAVEASIEMEESTDEEVQWDLSSIETGTSLPDEMEAIDLPDPDSLEEADRLEKEVASEHEASFKDVAFESLPEPAETEAAIEFALPEPDDNIDLAITPSDVTEEMDAQPAIAEQEEELIDEEILEIFAEEAEEVIDLINEHWPKYCAHYGATESLAEVRRAFHTLKGSGRMVHASVISELAWSVENLLNQIIEESVAMGATIAQLVDQVRAELPSLLQHFIAKTEHSAPVFQWQQDADLLAKGQAPMAMTSTEAAAEELSADAQIELESPLQEIQASDESDEESMTIPAHDALDAEDSDASLNAIFCAEAEVHLATLADFVRQCQESIDAPPFTEELYRALHTLKGSAHMAGLDAIAQIAAAAEMLTRELGAHQLTANQIVVDLLEVAREQMAAGVAQLATEQPLLLDAAEPLVARIQHALTEQLATAKQTVEEAAEPASPVIHFMREQVDAICDVTETFEQWCVEPRLDRPEFAQILNHIAQLNCAAREAQLPEIETLLATLEYVYRTLEGERLALLPAMIQALSQAHDGLVNLIDQLAANQQLSVNEAWAVALDNALTECQTAALTTEAFVEEQPVPSETTEVEASFDESSEAALISATDSAPLESFEQAETDAEETPATQQLVPESTETATEQPALAASEEDDPELIEIFLSEADEIMEATAETKQEWMNDPENPTLVGALQRYLHTLKGSSRMAGISGIGDLSHALESIYEDIGAGKIQATDALFDVTHACDDQLLDMISTLRGGQKPQRPEALLAQLQSVHHQLLNPDAAATTSKKVVFDTGLGATVEAESDTLEQFFTEAQEALKAMGSLVAQAATANLMDEAGRADLLRHLTRLQDAAYLSGVNEVGDLCQIFTELTQSLTPVELTQTTSLSDLGEWLERIDSSVEDARSAIKETLPEEEPLIAEDLATPAVQAATISDSNDVSGSGQRAKNETVRVSSTLLEQLVDLAGETSVSRSRVEQQVSNFGYAIDEMAATVERLREQLRRMEIETEAQILFRQEREGPKHQGFDPLEMDRYSRIQELSRALVESVSDLFDLKDTLHDRARYTETLLLQQSRINTELQEGLMKTRMVPFSRIVPRLQRIVRQTSGELGKKVDLRFKNIDAELDRSLLEHMTAPLEHMLRNAVDHGIEQPAQRAQQGKGETGSIRLTLARDGGDVLITLQDDGAGIDVESVRRKALERGLIQSDSNLSDHQILQFIMQAGFSTATQVTQISGRGVGMDVVSNEIKLLGGAIEIDSERNRGTRFQVRVPFTVSINRALMVHIGEEMYSLPLSTIEGVVRVSPYELEEYYRPGGPDFEYAGQKYDLKYLGDYLGHANSYQLQSHNLPLPVILVRTGEHTAAVQVDSISGSREIVVKPLGPQLGRIPGMSGATIMGDGKVVLILDMAAMIRHLGALDSIDRPVAQTANKVSENLQVMVVDDSVTVRKVASRLLERHGMDVIIAKDGVEAMTKLQDTLPDVMLLDIEMPRMDGFELASLMRHDERLRDVPIIMVTSRTGDKHRNRALEIGVNRFMGKPFQETELLEAIAELTDFQQQQTAQA